MFISFTVCAQDRQSSAPIAVHWMCCSFHGLNKNKSNLARSQRVLNSLQKKLSGNVFQPSEAAADSREALSRSACVPEKKRWLGDPKQTTQKCRHRAKTKLLKNLHITRDPTQFLNNLVPEIQDICRNIWTSTSTQRNCGQICMSPTQVHHQRVETECGNTEKPSETQREQTQKH